MIGYIERSTTFNKYCINESVPVPEPSTMLLLGLV
ncbi:MAG: PEP-CTERM sorting domain-containing protein [Deltaproteobacteria bacterium]|nr:PEP-CTERM sorting domain-containing protein [Deltaproteobacteria bacterium]